MPGLAGVFGAWPQTAGPAQSSNSVVILISPPFRICEPVVLVGRLSSGKAIRVGECCNPISPRHGRQQLALVAQGVGGLQRSPRAASTRTLPSDWAGSRREPGCGLGRPALRQFHGNIPPMFAVKRSGGRRIQQNQRTRRGPRDGTRRSGRLMLSTNWERCNADHQKKNAPRPSPLGRCTCRLHDRLLHAVFTRPVQADLVSVRIVKVGVPPAPGHHAR